MPYQATPLGRFDAPHRPRRDLIEDLEVGGWLERARRLAGGKSAPAYARSAMRRLEDALFQMTDANRAADGTCNALMALGGFVDWLATNVKVHDELSPPPRLSSAWIIGADDGLGRSSESPPPSPDSGCRRQGRTVSNHRMRKTRRQTMQRRSRRYRRRPPWPATSPRSAKIASPTRAYDVVTGRTARPCRTSCGERAASSRTCRRIGTRLVEAMMRGLDDKPLAGAAHARLVDVSAFLSGDFDDARCASPACRADLGSAPSQRTGLGDGHSIPLPFAYAALKPVFTPDRTLRRIGAVAEAARLPVPPGLIARLRAGGAKFDGRATTPRCVSLSHGVAAPVFRRYSIPRVRADAREPERTAVRAQDSERTVWLPPFSSGRRQWAEDPDRSRLSGRHSRTQVRIHGGHDRCRLISLSSRTNHAFSWRRHSSRAGQPVPATDFPI